MRGRKLLPSDLAETYWPARFGSTKRSADHPGGQTLGDAELATGSSCNRSRAGSRLGRLAEVSKERSVHQQGYGQNEQRHLPAYRVVRELHETGES